MIRLTTALANFDEDRTILVNPLHMITVAPVPTEAWDDSIEGQQQFERIKKMFPGARSEVAVLTGRSVWVMESPSEVVGRIEEWFSAANKLHRSAEESVS